MNKIDEIKILWEEEKKARPLLYVIDEEEIDYLFIQISILEQKVKELQENRSKIIQELNKQLNEAESRIKELEELR